MPRLSTVERWSYEKRPEIPRQENIPHCPQETEERTAVNLTHGAFLKFLLCFAVFSPAIASTAPTSTQSIAPSLVNTVGYINRTPKNSHTTSAFNSVGSSTLVAFVSSHPTWDGRPVSIDGLSDNVGNSWKLLEGPTPWVGRSVTLLSAIYYVNVPVTFAAHTVTVNLTNPAPLVVHVAAVSGSDITMPPLHSRIDALNVGATSSEVTADPIRVGDQTLLLGWSKNESSASATALDGYAIDQQSTGFLWAEYKAVHSAGSYASHFRYTSAIGHQTALVGFRASAKPVASSQALVTLIHTPMSVRLKALSPKGQALAYVLISGPRHGALSGTSPNLTYTPESEYIGADSVSFKVSDATGDSNDASVVITVRPKTFVERLQGTGLTIGFFSILSIGMATTKRQLKNLGVANLVSQRLQTTLDFLLRDRQ